MLTILIAVNTYLVVRDLAAAYRLGPDLSPMALQFDVWLIIVAPIIGIFLFWFGFRKPGLAVLQVASGASLLVTVYYHYLSVITGDLATFHYASYASTGLSLIVIELALYFTSLWLLLGSFSTSTRTSGPEIAENSTLSEPLVR